MYAKKNGSISFRSNKRSNYKKNIKPYSNHKPRSRGNVSQMYEKYYKLAKETSSSGDRIQAEYYYQFADHYYRLVSELGLKPFNNESSSDSPRDNIIQDEEQMIQTKEKNISLNESENSSEQSSDSIETVSFIAKPARKTSSKVKKEVS